MFFYRFSTHFEEKCHLGEGQNSWSMHETLPPNLGFPQPSKEFFISPNSAFFCGGRGDVLVCYIFYKTVSWTFSSIIKIRNPPPPPTEISAVGCSDQTVTFYNSYTPPKKKRHSLEQGIWQPCCGIDMEVGCYHLLSLDNRVHGFWYLILNAPISRNGIADSKLILIRLCSFLFWSILCNGE